MSVRTSQGKHRRDFLGRDDHQSRAASARGAAAARSAGGPEPPDLPEQPARLVDPSFPEEQLGQRSHRACIAGAPPPRLTRPGRRPRLRPVGPGNGPAAGPPRAGQRPSTASPIARLSRPRWPRPGGPASTRTRRGGTRPHRREATRSPASPAGPGPRRTGPSAIRCLARAPLSWTWRPPASRPPPGRRGWRADSSWISAPDRSQPRSLHRNRRVRSYHRRQPHRESEILAGGAGPGPASEGITGHDEQLAQTARSRGEVRRGIPDGLRRPGGLPGPGTRRGPATRRQGGRRTAIAR